MILLVFEISKEVLLAKLFLSLSYKTTLTISELRQNAGVKCFPSELKLGSVETDEL